GADAHAAQLGEALLDAALDDVLEVDDAEHLAARRHGQRRAARARDALDGTGQLARRRLADIGQDRIHRALADGGAVEVEAAHARLRTEPAELGAAPLHAGHAHPPLVPD